MIFEPHPHEFFAPDKAPTRLTTLREKLELLAAAGVDRVQICRFNFDFARVSAEDFIVRVLQQGLDIRWILVGDDFRFGARGGGDFSLLQAFSARCGFDSGGNGGLHCGRHACVKHRGSARLWTAGELRACKTPAGPLVQYQRPGGKR